MLLQFNDAERLSYSEIKQQLNMEDDDLIRVLFSLSCAKYKILNKDPDTKSVSPKDYFEFNSDFTDKMRRIKVGKGLRNPSGFSYLIILFFFFFGVD